VRAISWVRSFVFALVVLAVSATALATPSLAAPPQIGVGISVSIAPPVLPVYEQPICPGDGYIWTPGYWAYDDADGYYWVPGTWVEAPEVGFLWTPGYWGWGNGGYFWNVGYWGPHVGFYGGINYGFGYFGVGFEGGRWDGGHFFYNRAVSNVNVTVIHNVYNTEIHNTTVNRVSFNGGNGGIDARPRAEDEAYAHERHVGPVAAQTDHIAAAHANPQLRYSANHGQPAIAATPRPGAFNDREVVPARGGAEPARAGEPNNAAHPTTYNHVSELPPTPRGNLPSTGNPKTDQKYQQQQQKIAAKQDQERQKLQAQQDNEHQQLAKRQANDAQKQQVERKHTQQTQQLQQKHVQQQQHFEQHVQSAAPRATGHPK
jgi:hypothetical protein